jgi:hypothetical protein
VIMCLRRKSCCRNRQRDIKMTVVPERGHYLN